MLENRVNRVRIPSPSASAIIIAHLCGGFLVKDVAIDPAKGMSLNTAPPAASATPRMWPPVTLTTGAACQVAAYTTVQLSERAAAVFR